MSTALVAYATKNGSTRQVAEEITATLHNAGLNAQCRPLSDLHGSVDGFDLVVVGAPLYRGRWHRHAHRFLKRNRGLTTLAVFGMGPRNDQAEAWRRSREQLDRALAKHRSLAPLSVALFGGVDPPGRHPRRDLRDWPAISAWTWQLAAHVEAVPDLPLAEEDGR